MAVEAEIVVMHPQPEIGQGLLEILEAKRKSGTEPTWSFQRECGPAADLLSKLWSPER